MEIENSYNKMRKCLDKYADNYDKKLYIDCYYELMNLKNRCEEDICTLEIEMIDKYGKCKMTQKKSSKLNDQLEFAIQLATRSHAGQKDKGGAPYVCHPFYVMSRCGDIEEKIVAVLHDIVEDTSVNEKFIRLMFDEKIAEAVMLLTKPSDMKYEDYILRLANNKLARAVKLEDLKHNMNRDRLKKQDDESERRVAKYKKAYDFLAEIHKTN